MDFYKITRFDEIQEFHNITPIDNIPSIIKYGLLCHDLACKIDHKDISLEEVQARRDKKVPGGLLLHNYVNLYFHARNPMLFRRLNEEICILRIDKCVADLDDVVFSDRNAASDYTSFKSRKFVHQLEFEIIYAKDWRSPNTITYYSNKSQKCAEVLIPYKIDITFIIGAYVKKEKDKQELIDKGFNKEIIVNEEMFFGGRS
ncbi:DUF4433 domain-containing protein [bacterium]|nr:DUF4433 domain-containing protein [bacterium]